jgi:acetyl-CoA carboxylase carboxyl transferase subunit alpha
MEYLPFEKPIAALAERARRRRARRAIRPRPRCSTSARGAQLADLYCALTPWQRTQVARHPIARISASAEGLSKPFMPLGR